MIAQAMHACNVQLGRKWDGWAGLGVFGDWLDGSAAVTATAQYGTANYSAVIDCFWWLRPFISPHCSHCSSGSPRYPSNGRRDRLLISTGYSQNATSIRDMTGIFSHNGMANSTRSDTNLGTAGFRARSQCTHHAVS